MRTPTKLLADLTKTAISGIPEGYSLKRINASFAGSGASKPRRGPHGLVMGQPQVLLTVVDEETTEEHDLFLCLVSTTGSRGAVLRVVDQAATEWAVGGELVEVEKVEA